MSAAFVTFGYNAVVTIGGTVFAVKGGGYRIAADVHDVSDTVGGRAKTWKGGQRWLECRVNAERASDVDYHAAPATGYGIMPGDTINLVLFPNGQGNPGYASTAFVLEEFSGDFNVPDTQKVNFSGKGGVDVTLPGGKTLA